MGLLELAYFAFTLFLALVALMHWKRRRAKIQARLDRGLRGYIAKAPPEPEPSPESEPESEPGEEPQHPSSEDHHEISDSLIIIR